MKPLILTLTEHRPSGDRIRYYEITLDALTGDAQIRNVREPHADRDRSVEIAVGVEPSLVDLSLAVEVAP